jgi:hypothetical protein
MTSRELYEYALIELNKIEAPSLLLEDYNYFINKAVQQYINLVYAKIEVDQQSVDDLRVLKATTILTPAHVKHESADIGSLVSGGLLDSTYYVNLPADYMHLLNCVVEYTVGMSNFKCYNKGEKVYFAARRLTSDMFTQILNNAYLRPMYKRPYYYINNINPTTNSNYTINPSTGVDSFGSVSLPTNVPMDGDNSTGGIMNYNKGTVDNATKQYTAPSGANWSSGSYVESNLVDSENSAGDRLANPSNVRLELRFGRDDGIFVPSKLYIDYLKAPMYIRLTQEQINATLDYSQVLEFPDYVCFEIANIFTRLLMENAGDPRLQTNIPINNTIANPVLQQQQTQK